MYKYNHELQMMNQMVSSFKAELHKIMTGIQLTEIITAHYSCLKLFQLHAEVEDNFKG